MKTPAPSSSQKLPIGILILKLLIALLGLFAASKSQRSGAGFKGSPRSGASA